MKCPYRIKMVFEIELIPGTVKVVEKSQTQEYPDCYESDCPYYNPNGLCNRVIDELDEY